MRQIGIRLAALALAVTAALGPARASDADWQALGQPGTHIVMRHAIAPGLGDPPGFRLDDCSTQRNLDVAGRAQARRAGAAIRAAGVRVDLVLTSRWCRARETADLLGFTPVEPEPALDSFFADRSTGPRQTAALLARLAALRGKTAVLVTHQVNITALTGIVPASGEMLVIRPKPDGDGVDVLGRITP